jgi:asparagine synthase (glutamine-hydrolysing)
VLWSPAFAVSKKKVDSRILTKMRDSLEHRGLTTAGLFIENNIGFGHRRLSILDVSTAGHQPFLSNNGRYVMVYNGEIYNFKDFYPELKVRI